MPACAINGGGSVSCSVDNHCQVMLDYLICLANDKKVLGIDGTGMCESYGSEYTKMVDQCPNWCAVRHLNLQPHAPTYRLWPLALTQACLCVPHLPQGSMQLPERKRPARRSLL